MSKTEKYETVIIHNQNEVKELFERQVKKFEPEIREYLRRNVTVGLDDNDELGLLNRHGVDEYEIVINPEKKTQPHNYVLAHEIGHIIHHSIGYNSRMTESNAPLQPDTFTFTKTKNVTESFTKTTRDNIKQAILRSNIEYKSIVAHYHYSDNIPTPTPTFTEFHLTGACEYWSDIIACILTGYIDAGEVANEYRELFW